MEMNIPFISHEVKYKLEYLIDSDRVNKMLENGSTEQLQWMLFDIVAVRLELDNNYPDLTEYLEELTEKVLDRKEDLDFS